MPTITSTVPTDPVAAAKAKAAVDWRSNAGQCRDKFISADVYAKAMELEAAKAVADLIETRTP